MQRRLAQQVHPEQAKDRKAGSALDDGPVKPDMRLILKDGLGFVVVIAGKFVAVGIDADGAAKSETSVRIVFQSSNRGRYEVRTDQVVMSRPLQILAARQRTAGIVVWRSAKISRVFDIADTRVGFRQIEADFLRTIRRPVVCNDEFQIVVILIENRFDRRCNKICAIIHWQGDRNLWVHLDTRALF
jgi:hypothetical protein